MKVQEIARLSVMSCDISVQKRVDKKLKLPGTLFLYRGLKSLDKPLNVVKQISKKIENPPHCFRQFFHCFSIVFLALFPIVSGSENGNKFKSANLFLRSNFKNKKRSQIPL